MGDALATRAAAAYAAGDLDATLAAWEQAHHDAVRSNDRLGAAAAATRMAMHLVVDTGLLAPVRVWIKRAELHLEGTSATGVHAWLAVPRLYERLLSGDIATAGRWAREAIELGTAAGEPAAAAMGRVGEARCVIFEGDVARGLELLDEAAAFAVTGDVDPVTVGLVYCELVCAWQSLAQYDRAEELTAAMRRWCDRHEALGSVHGRCRVHQAEMLRLRGPCADAEREALRACDELRPVLRRELGWPLTELGTIRLQKGDLAGAEEAFVAAHEAGWEPQPGFALLLLAKGDVEGAASSIADALAHPMDVPSKELPPNTQLRRAPLLAAQAEIAAAAADAAGARSAAEELGEIATRYDSKALHARAATAAGLWRLASGEPAAARRDLERAVRLWTEIGAPYEAACARVHLAKTLRSQGDHSRSDIEVRAARAALERSGFAAPGLPPSAHPAAVHHGEFRPDGDGWRIEFAGAAVRLQDLKGLQYLARLLAQPGREFHVLDLVASDDPSSELRAASSSGEAVLDAQAKEAYRRRLEEIEDDIQDAIDMGDDGRAAAAKGDREFIVRELARAFGLGGRDRRLGADSERARVSITRAVQRALERIGLHHRDLHAHLQRALRTGTYCVYDPDPRAPVVWTT